MVWGGVGDFLLVYFLVGFLVGCSCWLLCCGFYFIREPAAKNDSFIMRSLEWQCLISTPCQYACHLATHLEHESVGNRHCSDAVWKQKMYWACSVKDFMQL